MSFSHGVWGLGYNRFWSYGWAGGGLGLLVVRIHTDYKFTHKFLMILFLVIIWCCLLACEKNNANICYLTGLVKRYWLSCTLIPMSIQL